MDICAVQLLEDIRAVPLLEDIRAVQLLEDIRAVQLIEDICAVIVYAFFCSNTLPSCFGSMFKKSNSLRTNNIVLQICKKSSLRNLPSFILPSKWNSLTQDLEALINRNSLKNHLSADYLNSYKNISCVNYVT